MLGNDNSHNRSGLFALLSLLALAAGVGAWFFTRGKHDEVGTLGRHREGAYSLAVAPDGRLALSGGGDGTVRVWDVAGRQQRAEYRVHTGRVTAVAWSPDGSLAASGGTDKSVRVFDVAAGSEKTSWTLLPRAVRGLAFSGDGKLLAAAVDRAIHLFDVVEGKELRVLRGHRAHIAGILFPSKRSELVTVGCDKSVRIWDPLTGAQLAQLVGPEGHSYGLSASADGNTLVAIGGGRAHFYDFEKRQPLQTIEPNAHALMGGALSPDGQLLAVGSEDKIIVLWDLAAGKERARLHGHGKRVGPVAFLPTGDMLVSASDDGSLKLWSVK
jgi:WD40 repeat protein